MERGGRWWTLGACVDNPEFVSFPDGNQKEEIQQSKKICKDCVVKAECWAYAYLNQIKEGIWGGTLSQEDRNLMAGLLGISFSTSWDDLLDRLQPKD